MNPADKPTVRDSESKDGMKGLKTVFRSKKIYWLQNNCLIVYILPKPAVTVCLSPYMIQDHYSASAAALWSLKERDSAESSEIFTR